MPSAHDGQGTIETNRGSSTTQTNGYVKSSGHEEMGMAVNRNGYGDEGEGDEERLEMNPLGLYLSSKPGRGRGVFTGTSIPAGTLLEESPVLVLTRDQWEEGKLDQTILGEYGFCWVNGGMAIALGMGESTSPHRSTKKKTSSRRV